MSVSSTVKTVVDIVFKSSHVLSFRTEPPNSTSLRVHREWGKCYFSSWYKVEKKYHDGHFVHWILVPKVVRTDKGLKILTLLCPRKRT